MLRPPIRKSASPIPVSRRRPTTGTMCSASTSPAAPTTISTPPPTISGRRPRRSPSRPAGGCASSAVMLAAADGDPDADAARAERAFGEPGQHRQDDADREEGEERRCGDEQESGRDHPLP